MNTKIIKVLASFGTIILALLFLLILLPVVAYFSYEAYQGLADPCYEKREVGKGDQVPFEVRSDRVCIRHSSAGLEGRYHRIRTLDGADPTTFVRIDETHFKDKNYVYYKASVLSEDPENFEYLGGNFYKDSDSIYTFHFRLDADRGTFEVLKGDHFAKDKDRVYYGYRDTIEADMESFQVLRGNYAKDKDNVYYTSVGTSGRSIIIPGADPATFETLDDSQEHWKARDKNSFYEFGQKVEGSNPDSYEQWNLWFSVDDNHVYYDKKILTGLDPKSFQQVGNTGYVKDSDSLFYFENQVTGVDPQKFRQVIFKPDEIPPRISWIHQECGTDNQVVVCGEKLQGSGKIYTEEELKESLPLDYEQWQVWQMLMESQNVKSVD